MTKENDSGRHGTSAHRRKMRLTGHVSLILLTIFVASRTTFAEPFFLFDDGKPCITDSPESQELAVIEQEDVCGSLTSEIDECLVGTWWLEPESYTRSLKRLQSDLPVPVELKFARMATKLLIEPSGIVQSCIQGVTRTRAQSPGSPIVITTKTKTRGTELSYVAMIAPSTLCGQTLRTTVSTVAETTFNGTTTSNTIPSQTNLFSVKSSYTCLGDNLTIRTYPPGVDYVEHTYRREVSSQDFNPNYCKQVKDACIAKCSDEILDFPDDISTQGREWDYRFCLTYCCRDVSNGRCSC